ncbi:MAG: multifunctional CCA tRNA nucleotidyl transferase/2'3'-cyclic phosphodiesterase/2'nucleotidase/phosphatase [Rhodocyclaceae bacterium]|nr:multifunctional CCA tRNA nucleotidyl transferase/2'3'-cyclic phosphodiesterase/2'nucleotidase/phosphatase [Rhodocyclaceae bacterium]
MRVYAVGGCVRDRMLGLPVSDRDWVVVGATPEQMIALGYRAVGRDFPVFLHPDTQEEYALARTERKTAPGYRGFAVHADPTVTLEEDLARRDLTINAMAEDETGTVIDPYGGRRDLALRRLRHVTPAFAEDPVRILRLARFAARFHDFCVAPETLALARGIVCSGEADALVPERVWQELSRGLMEARPARMWTVLRETLLATRLLPELATVIGGLRPSPNGLRIAAEAHLVRALDVAAAYGVGAPVCWAVLLAQLAEFPEAAQRAEALSRRLRVPAHSLDLGRLAAELRQAMGEVDALDAEGRVRLLERLDSVRRPQRLMELLQAFACDHLAFSSGPQDRRTQAGLAELYPPAAVWQAAATVCAEVDAGRIAREFQDAPSPDLGAAIRAAVHAERVRAVAEIG